MRTCILNPATILHFKRLNLGQNSEINQPGAVPMTNLQPQIFFIFAAYHPQNHPDPMKRGNIFRVHVASGPAATHMLSVNANGYNSPQEQALRAASARFIWLISV